MNGSAETERSAIMLTSEQEAIIASNGNIRINAVAGSGKTTTIIHYAATRPKNARILYLAFNRSVKLEARKRFAEKGLNNVTIETAHSLAYKPIVIKEGYKVAVSGYKTHEIAAILGLKSHGEKHGEYILANHINRFLTYFCNSKASRVQELNYLDVVSDPKAKTFARAFYSFIEKGTRRLLQKMNDGEIEIIHDFYLKKYQLSKPLLNYDYILFDEGQDASPAMLDIFLNQDAVKLIVGDTHQQIYSWRYAVNSLEKVDFSSFDLSTSFRFNPDIAGLAVRILEWKNFIQPERKFVITGGGSSDSLKQKATIARTNLGLLAKAITFIKDFPAIDKIYFEGNINSYTYADDGASLYDVLKLYNFQHRGIKDQLIKSMKDIDELEDYAEKTDDVQIGMMIGIVKKYGNEIPQLIKTLKSKHVGDEFKHEAEMIFSTVHRAKGMEYDVVELAEDFVTEKKVEKLKTESSEDKEVAVQKCLEEINLLYVAATRAKCKLRIPLALIPKDFLPSPQIEVLQEVIPDPDPVETEPYLPVWTKRWKRKLREERIPRPRSNYYDQIRLEHKNAFRPWSNELELQLKELFGKGMPIAELATVFERKEGAIVSRLKKLGCIESDYDL